MRGECYILFMALAALLADGQTTKTRRQDSSESKSSKKIIKIWKFYRVRFDFLVKPGVCPRSIIINVFCRQNLRDACQFDFQCPGRLKCCRTICNVNACSSKFIFDLCAAQKCLLNMYVFFFFH